MITTAWRGWLVEELKDWLPGTQSEKVDAALDRIVIG